MTISKTRDTRTGVQGKVWRPVQYLGSKLRALDSIVEAVDSVCEPSGTVWDPFTGSSVVAQAIAATGRRVIAHDTQRSAATFARALLGVDRLDGVDPALSVSDRLWQRVRHAEEALVLHDSFWEPWLAAEDEAIAAADAARLLEVSEALPQRWKASSLEHCLRSWGPGFACTLAGTYFGLRQALRIDALRAAVQHLEEQGSLAPWERDVLLTGLCHAASEAVFSVGKHFAQPLRATNGNAPFAHKRLLRDRTIDIDVMANEGVQRAVAAARAGREGHNATWRDALEVDEAYLRAENVGCVYADPPYTGQQYSRFYHVLETLVKGAPEPLQVWRGGVTRGLYPRDRYLSPFSSVTGAPGAFRSFITTVARSGAALVLSYSASSGRPGNARMVTLDDLRSWVGDEYGRRQVEVFRLGHKYRQFNSSRVAMEGRNDAEYLLIAVHR